MPVRLCVGGGTAAAGPGPGFRLRPRRRVQMPTARRTSSFCPSKISKDRYPCLISFVLPGDFSHAFAGFFLYTFSFPYGKITHWSFPLSGLCRSCHFSGGLLLGHSFLFHCRTYIVNPPMWIDIFSYLLLANISQFFHSIFNKSC